MIAYAFPKDGGFIAVDKATGRTAFAYATSPHETAARKHPLKVAREMLANVYTPTNPDSPSAAKVKAYDERNWIEFNANDAAGRAKAIEAFAATMPGWSLT
jgi:hypothetical protein